MSRNGGSPCIFGAVPWRLRVLELPIVDWLAEFDRIR
jgi:hypothetical protein